MTYLCWKKIDGDAPPVRAMRINAREPRLAAAQFIYSTTPAGQQVTVRVCEAKEPLFPTEVHEFTGEVTRPRAEVAS